MQKAPAIASAPHARSSPGFSSDAFSSEDQFPAACRRLIAPFGCAEVTRDGGGAFQTRIESFSVGKLVLSSMRIDPMTFERTAQHVALRGLDAFLIMVVLEGAMTVIQDGCSARLGPGDLVLCDCRRPFVGQIHAPVRQIAFHCDRAELQARLPDAERRVAQRITGQAALSSAVADYVAAIMKQVAAPGDVAPLVARHACEILAYALGGASPRDAASRSLLARIQLYIEDNLSDRALAPAAIAHHHRISRRQLYRLFADGGDSVAEYIRRRRLARSRTILGNEQHARCSMSEVALVCGFHDATTFGRTFRVAFGVTPRVYRRAARSHADQRAAAISVS